MMPPPRQEALHPALRHPKEAGDALRSEADLHRVLRELGPKVKALLMQKFAPQLTAEDAEDVLSVALQRMWVAREKYDPARANLGTWFYVIAQRAVLDVLKVGWRKARSLEVPVEDLAPLAATDTEPALPPAAPHPVHSALHGALQQLPAVQRQIIWADALGAQRGDVLSRDLGAELGLPAATVRVYRKRALEKLRQLLVAALPNYFSDDEPKA
jgi:RNA polymerase sigma-70 factor (ECF subfamily)